ncbi:MAG: menaquinone biosynthesis protein [Vicinamibacteria bacterium]
MSATASPPLRAPSKGTPATLLRLGAVSYLNAQPLIHGLDEEPAVRVEQDVPSRVAERLHAGEIDLGMIPSIEYAFGHYAIVPGIAIGSRGPVRSVSLYLSRPLEEVRRVALDTSSRTSVALLQLLLRERLGRDPQYVPMAPALGDMLAVADAALMIGDPVLDQHTNVAKIDVGEEWTRLTGLPFVYAFWAGPQGVVTPKGVERLQAALAAGLGAFSEIAARHAAGAAERAAVYEEYLRTNVVYRLEDEEVAGLREFYRRAHALDLAPAVPELSFHADH